MTDKFIYLVLGYGHPDFRENYNVCEAFTTRSKASEYAYEHARESLEVWKNQDPDMEGEELSGKYTFDQELYSITDTAKSHRFFYKIVATPLRKKTKGE